MTGTIEEHCRNRACARNLLRLHGDALPDALHAPLVAIRDSVWDSHPSHPEPHYVRVGGQLLSARHVLRAAEDWVQENAQ